MMPHPERCAEEILGNEDGKLIFLSLLKAMKVTGLSLRRETVCDKYSDELIANRGTGRCRLLLPKN